jgi:hypothetical protein
LTINFEKTVANQTTKSSRQMKIGVIVDANNIIQSCEAFGVPMNNYVLGDLTVSGSISAGSSVQLNAAGDNGFPPSGCGGNGSTPVGRGKLYYKVSNNGTYFCDGYDWYPLGAPQMSPPIGGLTFPLLQNCDDPQGTGAPCYPSGPPSTPSNDIASVKEVVAWCPPGYALSQLSGKSGWAFDYLSLRCQNSVGVSFNAGQVGNDQGGSAFTGNSCPTGSYISAIAFKTSSSENRACGYKITGLKYWCSTPGRPDLITQSYVRLGTHSPEFSGTYWQKFNCPHGQAIGEIQIWQERKTDWYDTSVAGTNRRNCDCRSCVANITAVCRDLAPVTSTTIPSP